MPTKVRPIPDGYPRLSPYLAVSDAARAITFYAEVFGAKERARMPGPGGTVGHAELAIGGSLVMLADASEEAGFVPPRRAGETGLVLSLYVEDVDRVVDRAERSGATVVKPVETRFYGDRSGQIVDPFGHRWEIATRVEDVAPDEMRRRAAALAEAT